MFMKWTKWSNMLKINWRDCILISKPANWVIFLMWPKSSTVTRLVQYQMRRNFLEINIRVQKKKSRLTLSPTAPRGPTEPGSPRCPRFPSSPWGPITPWEPGGPWKVSNKYQEEQKTLWKICIEKKGSFMILKHFYNHYKGSKFGDQ